MALFKRKDSQFFWIKISFTGGPPIQESTGTSNKKLAKEYHDRRQAQIWEMRRLNVRAKYSWKKASARWLIERAYKRTIDADRKKLCWLDTYLADCTLDQIDRDLLERIRLAKTEEASSTTANRYMALVRAILRCAQIEWAVIDQVPSVRMTRENNARDRMLSEAELRRLFAELPPHQRDVALFALLTGLRQSNVLNLMWSHVDLERHHAFVPRDQSKNGQSIPVPLSPNALSVLERQKGKHPTHVFSFKGKPVKSVNTRAWHLALSRAGITNFRWHDLRHSWASLQIRNGTSLYELQKLGGWKSDAMVQRYAHLAADQLKVAAARIDLGVPADLVNAEDNLPRDADAALREKESPSKDEH